MHVISVVVHAPIAIIVLLALLAITGKQWTMAYAQLARQAAPLAIMIQSVLHALITSIFTMIIVWTVLPTVQSVLMGPHAPYAAQGY